MKRHLVVSALLLLMPALLPAQAGIGGGNTQVKKRAKPSTSRVETKSMASHMAAGIQAAEVALTPAELAIAGRVYVGQLPCELGAYVTLKADAKAPGYFDMRIGRSRYRMSPVESRTGVVRLEDPAAGVAWLQLSNKSMLVNHKLGQRLADECMGPEQAAVAEALRQTPAPSLLEPAHGRSPDT